MPMACALQRPARSPTRCAPAWTAWPQVGVAAEAIVATAEGMAAAIAAAIAAAVMAEAVQVAVAARAAVAVAAVVDDAGAIDQRRPD